MEQAIANKITGLRFVDLLQFVDSAPRMDINKWIKYIEDHGMQAYRVVVLEYAHQVKKITIKMF